MQKLSDVVIAPKKEFTNSQNLTCTNLKSIIFLHKSQILTILRPGSIFSPLPCLGSWGCHRMRIQSPGNKFVKDEIWNNEI